MQNPVSERLNGSAVSPGKDASLYDIPEAGIISISLTTAFGVALRSNHGTGG
jgi:hypothetical protein